MLGGMRTWGIGGVLIVALAAYGCDTANGGPIGEGGAGGDGGAAGMAGGGGMAGGIGCPAGADSLENVNLQVTTGFVMSYEVPASGLEVTPGPDSGRLFGDASVGMGTDAISNPRSIESGVPTNESIVFRIFRSDGATLGIPEDATNMVLILGGGSATQFDLRAKDKEGNDVGAAFTQIGLGTVDVGALIPGEIHELTIEATDKTVTLRGIEYLHLCLGYAP